MAERKIQELRKIYSYGEKASAKCPGRPKNTKEAESDPFHLNRLENDVRILSREAEAELVWKALLRNYTF